MGFLGFNMPFVFFSTVVLDLILCKITYEYVEDIKKVQWDIVCGEFCLGENCVLKWTCLACFIFLSALPEQLKCQIN